MTNKVVLRTVEQFMADYTPIYNPISGLFMKNSQSYVEEAGVVNFKRVEAVGDLFAKRITPKDTSIAQIAIREGTKSYKKYFNGNQFVISNLQDKNNIEQVPKQVLDAHQQQFDSLFLFGEGTAQDSSVLNNGLYWSNDPNYIYHSSPASVSDLEDLHDALMESLAEADQVAGQKTILLYGVDTLAAYDSVYDSHPSPFKRVFADTNPGLGVAKMPAAVTPASAEGWIVVNLDQIKVHHSTLPQLRANGVNEEKGYAWWNFLMGSCMTEVLALNGIIRQDATVSIS